MDLLIELLTELAKLSGTALWIGAIAIIGLFVYKIFIVGSIYGVAKFMMQKVHDMFVTERPPRKQTHEWSCMEFGITGSKPHFEMLINEVHEAQGASLTYVHGSDIEYMRKAVEHYANHLRQEE